DHAKIGFDVGADVLGMAALLGLQDVTAAFLAHAALDRVDLRQVADHVETHDQLVEVAGHEGGHHLASALASSGEQLVIAGDHVLLLEHRLLFDDVAHEPAAHRSLHSLMESANVPACSRIGCICAEFSAYLKAIQGTPWAASTLCSIGRSSSAGSQKLGEAKITPSARLRLTASTR